MSQTCAGPLTFCKSNLTFVWFADFADFTFFFTPGLIPAWSARGGMGWPASFFWAFFCQTEVNTPRLLKYVYNEQVKQLPG